MGGGLLLDAIAHSSRDLGEAWVAIPREAARRQPCIGRAGEWGDHPEVQALEEALDLPFEVWSADNGPTGPIPTLSGHLPPEMVGVEPGGETGRVL